MPTKIITLKHGHIVLLSEETMKNAGLLGKESDHTDFKNATDSVFMNTKTLLESHDISNLIENVMRSSGRRQIGNLVYENDLDNHIGFDPLTTVDKQTKATGVILKKQYVTELKGKQKCILCPSYTMHSNEIDKPNTKTLSIIAPVTTDPKHIPEDVKDNPAVITAFTSGKLQTILSIYPGKSMIKVGNDNNIKYEIIPWGSDMYKTKGLLFKSHPDNINNIIFNDLKENEIRKLCELFNKETSIPSNDKESITNAIDEIKNRMACAKSLGIHVDDICPMSEDHIFKTSLEIESMRRILPDIDDVYSWVLTLKSGEKLLLVTDSDAEPKLQNLSVKQFTDKTEILLNMPYRTGDIFNGSIAKEDWEKSLNSAEDVKCSLRELAGEISIVLGRQISTKELVEAFTSALDPNTDFPVEIPRESNTSFKEITNEY